MFIKPLFLNNLITAFVWTYIKTFIYKKSITFLVYKEKKVRLFLELFCYLLSLYTNNVLSALFDANPL